MQKRKTLWGMIILWLCCFFLFIGGSYWVTNTQEDFNKVFVRFCNNVWESKHDDIIFVKPGEKKSLRLCVNNWWKNSVTFQYGFSKSTFASAWGRVCHSITESWDNFSILIPEKKERIINIQPGDSIVIEEDIVIPPGMSGLQMWCMLYKLKNSDINLWTLFDMEINKYGRIDVMVGWASDIQSNIELLNMSGWVFSTNKKMKAEVDEENNLRLSFLVKNGWNVLQNVVITGKIYNALWFQKDFSSANKQIAPWAEGFFEVDAGILPVYKWFFTIKINVQNIPQLMFDVSNKNIDRVSVITEKWKIFLFSWIYVIIVVLSIFLLYKLLAPKKRKID